MLSNSSLHFIRRQRAEFSKDGEAQAAQMLAEYGFLVYFNSEHPYHGYDLMVYPNVMVEVKISAPRTVNQKLTGYQFNLFRVGRSKRIHEPIVMLLCQSSAERTVPFIIPSEVVVWKNAITIGHPDPMRYSGKWSHYRKAFDRVLLAGGRRFPQGRVTDDFQDFMREQPYEN